MIEHINLLAKRRIVRSLAWFGVRGVGVVVLALAALALNTEMQLRNLRQAHDRTQQSIVDLKGALEKKRREAGLQDAQVMGAQTALLRAQVATQRSWLDQMGRGELGTPRDYGWLLEKLASVHEEGVWLQGVDVDKGDQSITISGKSLSAEAVLRYAEKVNAVFKNMDIQFAAMEISQVAPSGDTTASVDAGVLKFKIF